MTVRAGVDQPFAARRATLQADHVGLGPGLIEEDQFAWVQAGLGLTPFSTGAGDVRAVLFGGVQGLFLRVRFRCAKVSQTTVLLAETLCISSSQA